MDTSNCLHQGQFLYVDGSFKESQLQVETTCLKPLDVNETHCSGFQRVLMQQIEEPLRTGGGVISIITRTGCSEYDGPLFVAVARWDLLGSAIMTDS